MRTRSDHLGPDASRRSDQRSLRHAHRYDQGKRLYDTAQGVPPRISKAPSDTSGHASAPGQVHYIIGTVFPLARGGNSLPLQSGPRGLVTVSPGHVLFPIISPGGPTQP